jgi:hypothetical protein
MPAGREPLYLGHGTERPWKPLTLELSPITWSLLTGLLADEARALH